MRSPGSLSRPPSSSTVPGRSSGNPASTRSPGCCWPPPAPSPSCFSSIKLPSITGSSSHPTGTGLRCVLLFRPPVMAFLSTIVLLFQATAACPAAGITTLGAERVQHGDRRTVGRLLVVEASNRPVVEPPPGSSRRWPVPTWPPTSSPRSSSVSRSPTRFRRLGIGGQVPGHTSPSRRCRWPSFEGILGSSCSGCSDDVAKPELERLGVVAAEPETVAA